MKKFIILSIVSILLLTGCGENMTETMSCTHKNETDNLTAKIKYDIDYQDKTVKKVRITYDYVQKNNDNEQKNTDGIDTGTDGTTEDTQPDDDGIIQGDSVETSGLGGIYPKGIHVGSIKRVVNTQNTTDRYAIVETAVDFDKLDTVLVITNQ